MVSTSDHAEEMDWGAAFARLFSCVVAMKSGRALYVLLASFAAGGFTLTQSLQVLSGGHERGAIVLGAAALFIVFYGANAAGLMMMDAAQGLASRDVGVALQDALGVAHRVLVALLVVLACGLAGGALVWGLFWLCGLPVVGSWLFTLVVPATVVLLGVALLAGTTVVGLLAGPAVWAGASSVDCVRTLWALIRHRLLEATALATALGVITALVGGALSFIVMAGGRVMAQLSVWMLGVDVAPELFMAGLFGHGLQMTAATDVPAAAHPYVMAASVGGGLVFALAVVLPTLVYLRGACEIYLLLRGRLHDDGGAAMPVPSVSEGRSRWRPW